MNKKIFLSMVLVLSLVLSLATVSFADGNFKLNVSAGDWNENQEIELIVSVEGNPGITGFGYSVVYDSGLVTPLSVDNVGLLEDGGATISGISASEGTLSCYNVSYFDIPLENVEGDGNIHKMIFKLAGKATAENSGQAIEFKLAENPTGLFYNKDGEDLVEVVPEYGSVTVNLPVIENTEAKEDEPVDDSGFSDISDDFNDYVENYKPTHSGVSGTTGTGTSTQENRYKTIIVLTIDSVEIKVNKNTLINDVAPIIVNDRTMLPIRVIAEELGAEVGWDEAQQKVTVTKDDKKITVYIDSDTAYVNDEVVKLDSPAFIQNSRTFLPLRFISENLGAEVDWDGDLQQVTIKK